MKIVIEDLYDGFYIVLIDSVTKEETRYHFDQEDSLEDMVKVFKKLGFNDVHYEEVC